MSENLKIHSITGAQTIDVMDEKDRKIGEFEFNPTDSNILKRYDAVVDWFNGVQPEEQTDDGQDYKAVNKLAAEIEEQFDFLLGFHVSEGIFKNCGPLTLLPNGDFFFENILEGIGKIIEAATNQRINKKLAKVRKATAKYQKK